MENDIKQTKRPLKSDFDRDGYVHVDALYYAPEVAEIRRQLDRFVREKVPEMPEAQVYYEDRSDRSTLKQLQQMFHYDDWFAEMMLNGPARRIAEEVLQDEVVPINMQYFNKPAGIGQRTPPHQDGVFFHLTPVRR